MGTIYANEAIRIKLKKIIHAHGIIDGHAHHNSGACCPLPLIYAQLEDGSFGMYPRTVLHFRSREWCEKTVGLKFKEGVNIQRLSTFEMGNLLAKINIHTFANIRHSMDFADEFKTKPGGDQIATLMIVATMDMERAHIAGYDGQTIYHEEDGKLFYFERMWGNKPEREGNKRDLSHEIIVNKIYKTKVLKLKKWEIQCSETENAAINNPLHLLPLYFYDPRRFNRPTGTTFPESKQYGAWDEIFNFIATESKPGIWVGAKMYPPLGHKPLDELCEYLPDFYHRCEKEQIPILTHCSPGGMTTHEAGHYLAFDFEKW